MSQLIAPTHTAVDQIPLGRRIMEIMQEKGPAFTITAMAKRLEINRETFRLMLKGEREIYNYELDKIAKDLKVPVERILQTDEVEKRKRFNEMMIHYTDLENGAELSDSFLQSAVGVSERFFAVNNKGRYWNSIGNFSQSHETYLKALPLATSVLEKYGDAKLLLMITANLSITYSARKEYTALSHLISKVEDHFDEYPWYSGIICFSLARIHEGHGEIDKTLEKCYHYLSYMEKTCNANQIAKARYNTAVNEYRMKNYLKALELYEGTTEYLKENHNQHFKCMFYQEYGKTLLRLNKVDQAKEMLQIAEEIIKTIIIEGETYKELEAHLFLLLAIVKNDPCYAETLVRCEDYNLNIRKIACKFLIDYYDEAGDATSKEEFKNINKLRYVGIDMLLSEKKNCAQYLLTLLDICSLVGWHKI